MPLKVLRRNVERGFYNATGFHPLRRSRDYDPDRPDEPDSGARTDAAGWPKKKRRNVQAGFYDATGFHPLRRSRDYDPDRPDEPDSGARTDAAGLRVYRGRKITPIRKARKKSAASKRRNPAPPGSSLKWKWGPNGSYLADTAYGTYKITPVVSTRGKPKYQLDFTGVDSWRRGHDESKTMDGAIRKARAHYHKWWKAQRAEAKRNGLRNGARNPLRRPRAGNESPRVRKALTRYVRGGKRNPVSYSLVQAANGAGEQSGREWPTTSKPSATSMDREFKDWLAYRRNSIPEIQTLTPADRKQLRGVFFRGVRQGYGSGGRRNPKDAAGGKRHWQVQSRDLPTHWFKTKAEAVKHIHSQLRRGLAGTTYITLYNTLTGDYADYSNKLTGQHGYGEYPTHRNPPHSTYAKQVGASVGYRDASDGKPKQSAAALKDHYSRSFSEPDDPALLKQIGYSPAEIARERAAYRKAQAAFLDGYRFGYAKYKSGFRGLTSHIDREVTEREDRRRRGRNPGKQARRDRARSNRLARSMGAGRYKGPKSRARYHYKTESSIARGRMMKRPSERPYLTRNPGGSGSKVYEVRVPSTYYDSGYTLTIRAKSKRTARAEAKAYCASTYARATGKPKSTYKLPTNTKVTEVS